MANDEKKSGDKIFYRSSKSYKIVISLIISAILAGSFFVITKISSAYIVIENEESLELHKTDMELSGEISDTEIELKANVKLPKTKAEKQKGLIIGLSVFLILALAVISLLVYLAVSDDSGIRFAKLNELRNLRKDISLNFSDKEKVENIKEVETEFVQFPQPKDLCQTNSANVNINYNLPAIKTEKEKSLYAEFLKNYMNAIVEI